MDFINKVLDFINQNSAMVSSIFGVAMVFIAKIFPNADAGAFISKIQAMVDMVAKFVSGIGMVLKAISDFLASLIKSDGIMGKK